MLAGQMGGGEGGCEEESCERAWKQGRHTTADAD
jgi:hypothetical protein